MYSKSATDWVNENFEKLPFTDPRRTNRAIKVALAMVENPGKQIPGLCENFYDVKATYNLFKHVEATPETLQATHRKLLHKAMQEEGEYLLIEDTSDMSFSSKRKKIAGLGPIGRGTGSMQGFLLHSILVAKWQPFKNKPDAKKPSIDVLGLVDQQYEVRHPTLMENGKKIPRKISTKEQCDKKESAVWEKSLAHLPKPLPEKNIRFVRVCDRGADIYEVLDGCLKNNFGFVIRAAQNRCLENSSLKLFDYAQQAQPLGNFDLFLRTRPNQPAETINLCVAAQSVVINSPRRTGFGNGKLSGIKCSVVRVFELNPPQSGDREPLEWFLLCDQEISTFEQAINCVVQYSCRWLIEDFHKALKSCLGAEKLQLETADRLFAAISLMSIVALRLISLREQFRISALKPAHECYLTKLELNVLATYLKRTLTTIHDVNLALGRLGGHLNRKSDGAPGLLVLWRGILKLQNLVEGYKMASQSCF